MTVDDLKKVNLVELLSRCWKMNFRPEGAGFKASSPFQEDADPSFYLCCAADGHWLFCDHSDGSCGSIIDLMMRKLGTDDFGAACQEARRLVQETGATAAVMPSPEHIQRDWGWLLEKLRRNDGAVCRDYLLERNLDRDLIETLVERGLIVCNSLDGSRYCCFAVYDAAGELQALFNRRMDGQSAREKFILGQQYPFCLDWEGLQNAEVVYVCEGIIDALSILTLRSNAAVVGTPGAHFDMEKLPLPDGVHLIDAFDADRAGRDAAQRLKESFSSHKMERFDLDQANDVNEYLQELKRKTMANHGPGKLTIEQRTAIALSSDSSRKLAAQYGVHHSRICDIRNDAARLLQTVWKERRPGPSPVPPEPEELTRLNEEHAELKREHELLLMRRDWLQLQIDMHEARDAEVEKQFCKKKRGKKARQRRKKS